MAVIALVANSLHYNAIIGYNRYVISFGQALNSILREEPVWIPLPSGVHPIIEKQLPGRILRPIRRGIIPGSYDWLGAERRVKPILWHVLTDLPAPLLVRGPVIVTCHGLPRWLRHRHMIRDGQLSGSYWQYQDFPFRLSTYFGLARDWLATKLALHRASAIIADSNYVRWELVNKFGIRPEKIHIVHLAADPVFWRSRAAEEIEEVRTRYGLPDQFVLGVASFSRTKNTEGLLRLAADLARAQLPPLVLVGPAGSMDKYLEIARAYRLFPGRTLFMLQNIPDDDLACVYRAACVFVNLAWEESFGLPIVEAMTCGIPVVGSNRTAVPEVIGEGGIVVDPADSTEVYRTVREVVTSPQRHAELRLRARARAQDFSWSKAAREVVAIYEKTIGERLGHSFV